MLITSGQISVNVTNFTEAIETFLVLLKKQAGRERGKKKRQNLSVALCSVDLCWIKLLTESQH